MQIKDQLNEHGKLVCLVAAQIIAGERSNISLVNPGNAYDYNPQKAFNAANDLIRFAMQFPELRESA